MSLALQRTRDRRLLENVAADMPAVMLLVCWRRLDHLFHGRACRLDVVSKAANLKVYY